jgi:hypothetical protein
MAHVRFALVGTAWLAWLDDGERPRPAGDGAAMTFIVPVSSGERQHNLRVGSS